MSAHPARDTYFVVRHDINHGGFPPFSGEQMSRLRDAADNALAEMELEVQRAKFQSYNELRQRAEQAEAALAEERMSRQMYYEKWKHAEAALAERDRMLRLAVHDKAEVNAEMTGHFIDGEVELILTQLRARTEEGSQGE